MRCCVIPEYTTTKMGDFVIGLWTCSPAVKVIYQNKCSPLLFFFTLWWFSHSIGPHKKGFWLFSTLCDPSALADDKGSRGSGSVPSRPKPGWVGWVTDEGRLEGWFPPGRGKEALYGREVDWEDMEVVLSWFRVSLEASLWNGLLAGGALNPWGRKKNKAVTLSVNLVV